jgi:hypothetical protein
MRRNITLFCRFYRLPTVKIIIKTSIAEQLQSRTRLIPTRITMRAFSCRAKLPRTVAESSVAVGGQTTIAFFHFFFLFPLKNISIILLRHAQLFNTPSRYGRDSRAVHNYCYARQPENRCYRRRTRETYASYVIILFRFLSVILSIVFLSLFLSPVTMFPRYWCARSFCIY